LEDDQITTKVTLAIDFHHALLESYYEGLQQDGDGYLAHSGPVIHAATDSAL
jgi:hypothetical protein